MLFMSLYFISEFAYCQGKYQLSGRVLNEDKQTLPGATIFLHPIEKGTISDPSGNYTFSNLKSGGYYIEVAYIGYKTWTDSIKINGNESYDIQLEESSLNLEEVVVKDKYSEIRKKEESLNIEIVNDDYLKQNMGGSLMNSLERLPGITTIEIGSSQSKPVIRGMGFNRVVVTENGIKHEGQQWGADHGLEVDQYAIDNIEVIKGPASLMYGSDAIGGVIDLNNRKIPSENTIGGRVDLTGKTNNDYLGTSLFIYGRRKYFFADFRATLLDYGDYKVPADSVDIYSYRAPLYKQHLRNTAGKEYNFHFSIGIVKPDFFTRFYISNIFSKSGFFANAHGIEPLNVDTELHDNSSRDINYPFQQVDHFKINNRSNWHWNEYKFDTDLGFQRNFRQEKNKYTSHGYMPTSFPDTLGFASDLERQFDKYIFSGNFKVTREINKKNKVVWGFNGEYQVNNISGCGFIIPKYNQLNLGTYALGKHYFSDKSIIQLGLRYDFGRIKTFEYHDWFKSEVISNSDTTWQYLVRAEDLDKKLSDISWSIGYNYISGGWSLKANVGKSFRMPIAKELAADGVNYHFFRYEVGNTELDPEISYQLDLGTEYNSKRFAIGLTPFLNYFSNYIYLNPTSEHDQVTSLQIFNYTQSKVFRWGGEAHVHYELINNLKLGLIGECVYSQQLSGAKKGYTLPFSPPASMIINLKYQKSRILFLINPYLSLDYRITAAQENIVPPEKTTDGYQIVNLGFGSNFNFLKQNASFSFQVLNLFNTKYFNHTSFYRLINVPEAGRNLVLNISIPFSGTKKNIN